MEGWKVLEGVGAGRPEEGGGGRIKGWKNTGNLSLVFVSSLQSYLSETPFITKICI